MFETIRSAGVKPPFFIVHGLHGVMPLPHDLEGALGRDRPIYALHARGIVGTEPPHESVEDMVSGYFAQIREARPSGPYVLAGICAGAFVAMELARALTAAGEFVGTVILLDPPAVPHSHYPLSRTVNPKTDRRIYRQACADVEPMLRKLAARFDLPFDANDAAQLRRAIDVAIATHLAFYRYVPPPYDGPTEFIISAGRARGHLRPEGPWKNIVARPGRFHIIPGRHYEFFFDHLDEVLRLVGSALDRAFDCRPSHVGNSSPGCLIG
jgi:thioesterase domain-containing protein